jgi:hypothetical protein
VIGKKLLVTACCFFVSACASTWTLVNEENKQVKLDQITLKIPDNWVFYNNHYNNYTAIKNGSSIDLNIKRVVVTRNGLTLDFIDILQFNLANAFPSLGKSAHKSMLPSELAELFIAEQKIMLGIDYVQIVKNEPVAIADQQGFLVQLRFKNKNGLQIEQLVYGFATMNSYYTFKFTAPSLHYFDTNLPEFEALIASVKLTT